MPYRIDLRSACGDAFDRLVDLGALDVESADDGAFAAVMPDGVSAGEIARALDAHDVRISPAVPRDDGSVWVIRPRRIQCGALEIAPAGSASVAGALELVDGAAFGTGLHPTTTLCLEALQELVAMDVPDVVLDVGTGSGVLALAALALGVPRAIGIDLDAQAVRIAAENARHNGLADRFDLHCGGPATAHSPAPLVIANINAASLIEMAPALARRLGHGGHLLLSGIAASLEAEVAHAYRRLGLRLVRTLRRAGWVALVLRASW